MKKVFFATGNISKINRYKDKLLDKGIEIISINDIDVEIDIDENGSDAISNALIKARGYAGIVDYPIMAIDECLYIEGIPLDKQPGMYVRRVNGKRLSDDEMIDYYSNLAHVYGDNGKLTCKWVYGIAIINNGIEKTYSWEKDDFYLVDKASNIINPGYPLSSLCVDKRLNMYFTDISYDSSNDLFEVDNGVIDFISANI